MDEWNRTTHGAGLLERVGTSKFSGRIPRRRPSRSSSRTRIAVLPMCVKERSALAFHGREMPSWQMLFIPHIGEAPLCGVLEEREGLASAIRRRELARTTLPQAGRPWRRPVPFVHAASSESTMNGDHGSFPSTLSVESVTLS